MTASERAADITEWLCRYGEANVRIHPGAAVHIRAALEAQILEAMKEEQEACAKICEQTPDQIQYAAAIRSHPLK